MWREAEMRAMSRQMILVREGEREREGGSEGEREGGGERERAGARESERAR